VPGLSANTQFVVHNNNLLNAERAVLERVKFVERNGVFERPPRPNARLFRERLKPIYKLIARKMGTVPRMPYHKFVNAYSGRQFTIYNNAWRSLELNPLNAKDYKVKAFVKAEKIAVTAAKPSPAPRLIQPRHPRYHVELGRFLKPMEHRFYRVLDEICGGKTVMKGLNAIQRAEAMFTAFSSIPNAVWIGLDMSRFDQHVSIPALLWEHALYLCAALSIERPELRKLLNAQLRNHGIIILADGKVSYTTEGCRMSGDMNTALGNVLLMIAMLYTYMEAKGVPYKIIDDGDDAGIIISKEHLDHVLSGMKEWFIEMGFTAKIAEPVFDFCQIEFCKTKPVFARGRWILTRLAPDSFSKDACTLLPLNNEKAVRNYYKSIGDCGLALGSGVPIFQSYYTALLRAAGSAKGFGKHDFLQSGLLHLSRGIKSEVAPITTEARVTFSRAFGICPDEQCALEEYYDSLTLPTSVDSSRVGPYSRIHLK
jgi:hypothetical protein